MSFVFYNPNRLNRDTDDCTVRAISKLFNEDWRTTYLQIVLQGYMDYRMPSTNATWSALLARKGYHRHVIPENCPDCLTIRDFSENNPTGRFLVATGEHVVAIVDGNYYDTWDSGDLIPIYYWEKEK